MIQASVTVPLCMAVPVIAMLIFGLLEAARYYGLKSDAKEWSNLAAESLFAGYQPFLLEEYQLFFLDGGFGSETLDMEAAEDKIEALLYGNVAAPPAGKGICLYRMDVVDVDVTKIRLATDDNGKVFEMQAAKSMKQSLGHQAAKRILERVKGVKEKGQDAENPEEYLENAGRALEELSVKKAQEAAESISAQEPGRTEALAAETVSSGTGTIEEAPLENPIEVIGEVRKKGILSLALPKGASVSGKSVSTKDCLLKRNCQKGTYAQAERPGWYERILMQEYVKDRAGNAIEPKENGALSYGTEYLICGKDSDEKNLEKVAEKLVLLREAANFLYLQSDAEKKAQALAAATAIAGASVNPAVIEIVKQGILAAWAYAESICDVKELLSGGRTPPIKNSANWKTGLSGLGGGIAKDYGNSGESEGLSYENYLDVLLYGKSVKTLAYRSMDLMEMHMQNEAEYAMCRMDHMVAGAKISTDYSADTLFLGIFGTDSVGGYRFSERTEYAYES